MKKLLCQIFLIAANLRLAITALSPLTGFIQDTWSLSSGELGFLTTVPLLCFGFSSILAGTLINRWGTRNMIAGALLLLGIANLLRVIGLSLFWPGTICVGMAIALLNVALPVLIVEYAPAQTNFLNGFYVAAFNAVAALAGGLIVPLAEKLGWQGAVQLLSIPAVLGALSTLLLPKIKTNQSKKTRNTADHPWKQGKVWLLALFMGMQSLIFYVLVAWLPMILSAQHLSTATSGWLFSLFQIVGIPCSYLIPQWMTDKLHNFMIMAGLAFGYVLGILLLIISHGMIGLGMACIVLGMTTAAIFSYALGMIIKVADSQDQVSAVSGFVQSVSYFIASIGPVGSGLLKDQLPSWTMIMLILLAAAMITIGLGWMQISRLKND